VEERISLTVSVTLQAEMVTHSIEAHTKCPRMVEILPMISSMVMR
jgi:hypothetical protein